MNFNQEMKRVGRAVKPPVRAGLAAAGRVAGKLRRRARDCLRDQMNRRRQPEMVYISAPGRIREEDIRVMMEAARSVYCSGRIPVCPYLMFPVDGVTPETSVEAGRKMRFRLMDRCQVFLICGTKWTDEMWAEANHAITRGMEIQTDQGVGGRPAARLRLPAPCGAREAS